MAIKRVDIVIEKFVEQVTYTQRKLANLLKRSDSLEDE